MTPSSGTSGKLKQKENRFKLIIWDKLKKIEIGEIPKVINHAWDKISRIEANKT